MKDAAKILKLQKNEILDSWEDEVKKEVPASNYASSLALRDHLPHLLNDIDKIMHRYENSGVIKEKEKYEEIFQNSLEHGRHRSTSSRYTVDQILREYIIFHRILTNVLLTEEVYTTEVGIVLKFSIENAMLYSASSFNNSVQEMRQKLIGILAHDMRNPISAAMFSVDIMKYEDGQQRFDKIKVMVQKSLKRANDLIEGLLDSVTIEAGQGMTLDFTEINIMEYIESVYKEASEIYSNKIILKGEEDEIRGVSDGTMIRRVLENFISNAIKYGNRETPVTISVENSEEFVFMSVHNQGNPIPKSNQKEIFDFMNTSQKNGTRELKSWGMGLTLVKAVAEAHGGSVELESNHSKGTTFSIILKKYENRPGKKRAALNLI